MTSHPPLQFQQEQQQDRVLDTADAAVEAPGFMDFRTTFREAPYYSAGRIWDDYAPAYRFGCEHQRRAPDERFEDAEARLSEEWAQAKGASRLGWVEARGAIEDAWHACAAVGVADDDGDDQIA